MPTTAVGKAAHGTATGAVEHRPTVPTSPAKRATGPTARRVAGRHSPTVIEGSSKVVQTPRIKTVPTVRIGPTVDNSDETTALDVNQAKGAGAAALTSAETPAS